MPELAIISSYVHSRVDSNLNPMSESNFFPSQGLLITIFFIIYLSRVLCLCIVCVSQFVAERSAMLLVLVIKLTKETRRRVWRWRD
jgi:hypothetical protein